MFSSLVNSIVCDSVVATLPSEGWLFLQPGQLFGGIAGTGQMVAPGLLAAGSLQSLLALHAAAVPVSLHSSAVPALLHPTVVPISFYPTAMPVSLHLKAAFQLPPHRAVCT